MFFVKTKSRSLRWGALPVAMLLALLTARSVAARSVDFSRDVLPILSDKCFHCHGPDPKEARKGDLRLDDEFDAKRDEILALDDIALRRLYTQGVDRPADEYELGSFAHLALVAQGLNNN